jgi:hypothetical protein
MKKQKAPSLSQLDKLKKELSDLQEYNISAWNTYGSELCAGSMNSEERFLEERIRDLELELKPKK